MLNKEQKEAALSLNPAIVTAGPGSGKTKTLTERVSHLLRNKISPTEILCFTFTRSAATEMKERLEKKFNTSKLTITTIHAFCLNILRKNYHLLGYKEHIITYDDVDSNDLMSLIAAENNWIYKPKKPESSPDHKKILQEYNNRLKEYNAVNFEQMQNFVIMLLEQGKLEHIQHKYRYILVDEMQDTSDIDYKLITLLGKFYHNVFAVGDIDQELFSFRGANPYLIGEIEKFNENGYKVELNKSYRCPQPVLDLCNKLSATKLKSMTNCDIEPIFNVVDSQEEECDWMIDMVETYQSDNVGILCRTNRMIEFVSQYFSSKGFEHHVMGDQVKLIDRQSVRTFISFLKFWYNNNDYLSFYRIMPILHNNMPGREINTIKSKAIINDKSLLRMAESEGYDMSLFREGAFDMIKKAGKLLNSWYNQRAMTTKAMEISEFESEVESWLEENPILGLDDYLYYISDMSVTAESHKEIEEHKINLMTVHASKGLEFDTVFIPQINHAIYKSGDRNVLFVAMSRTKKNLLMSYSKFAYLYGVEPKEVKPSVFLKDIELTGPIKDKPKKHGLEDDDIMSAFNNVDKKNK